MEEILHFPGQRRLSNKIRHYTVQPTLSDCDLTDDDKNNQSPLIKKKSHFAKVEKASNINVQECELTDEDSHTPLSTFPKGIPLELIIIELKDNFMDGATKEKNFSKVIAHRKNSRNKTTDSTGSGEEEKMIYMSKTQEEKSLQDCPPEKEELKNEPTESFANKKRLGLRVNVKKHFPGELKTEELNSSDKLDNMNRKKNIEGFINNHPFRNLIFSPSVTESTFKRHLTITYRGLVYAKKCLKGPSESYIRAKQVNLVDSKSKITV